MKRQIRIGVFETNSSSTHSLTMCSGDDYKKWEKGEILLNENWHIKKQFITKDEAIQYLKEKGYYNGEENLTYDLRDSEFYTTDAYFDDSDLETFENTYTTANGEEVVAFGKYGHD